MKLRGPKGFTQVELVVVLGILVCLVGILLPALTRAREQGRRAQCLSHLRQLTTAWLAYASDNESRICSSHPPYVFNLGPPKFFWSWIGPMGGQKGLEMGKLWPYLNNVDVYRCPADQAPFNDTSAEINGRITTSSSYQINGLLAGTVGSPPFFYLNDIPQPAKTFVFIEGCPSSMFLFETCFLTPLYPKMNMFTPAHVVNNQTYVPGSLPGENHRGSASTVAGTGISFADGHAIFWQYSDPRTGRLLQGIEEGRYNTGAMINGVQPIGAVGLNSSDVLQLEAWSGGLIPPGIPQ